MDDNFEAILSKAVSGRLNTKQSDGIGETGSGRIFMILNKIQKISSMNIFSLDIKGSIIVDDASATGVTGAD